MLLKRDCTITATYAIEKVMCAMVMVPAPRDIGQPINSCRLTNINNSDRPVITSGMTRGAAIRPVNMNRPRYRPIWVSAIPAIVPKMVAKVALVAAILRLSNADSII